MRKDLSLVFGFTGHGSRQNAIQCFLTFVASPRAHCENIPNIEVSPGKAYSEIIF